MTARQYFGTDGIRGTVGQPPITPDFVLRLAHAVGRVLKKTEARPTVLIGKDTRISGYMLESALESGFNSAGVNVVLLGGYTLGCHSFRHLVGGRLDQLSKSPTCHKVYDCVSCLNRGHMLWAWCSLFWVAFSDLYVRMCSMGVWRDWRIL